MSPRMRTDKATCIHHILHYTDEWKYYVVVTAGDEGLVCVGEGVVCVLGGCEEGEE